MQNRTEQSARKQFGKAMALIKKINSYYQTLVRSPKTGRNADGHIDIAKEMYRNAGIRREGSAAVTETQKQKYDFKFLSTWKLKRKDLNEKSSPQ